MTYTLIFTLILIFLISRKLKKKKKRKGHLNIKPGCLDTPDILSGI